MKFIREKAVRFISAVNIGPLWINTEGRHCTVADAENTGRGQKIPARESS